MYAIIEVGGKQYRVSEGDVIYVEKLEAPADSVISVETVIAVGEEGKELKVGSPYVSGATISAKVIKTGKAKKIVVFTYRPKKGSKRKLGHRQPYTKLQIEKISA